MRAFAIAFVCCLAGCAGRNVYDTINDRFDSLDRQIAGLRELLKLEAHTIEQLRQLLEHAPPSPDAEH